MKIYSCSSCGHPLPDTFQYSKLAVCSHCNSSFFLQDISVVYAGLMPKLAEIPSLFKIGQHFECQGKTYNPQGRARYDFGKGLWDHWWMWSVEEGHGQWFCYDEGDLSIETKYFNNLHSKIQSKDFTLGSDFNWEGRNYRVTEVGKNCCIGAEGVLPKKIDLGLWFDTVDLLGLNERLLTINFKKDGPEFFEGQWLDPFAVTISP